MRFPALLRPYAWTAAAGAVPRCTPPKNCIVSFPPKHRQFATQQTSEESAIWNRLLFTAVFTLTSAAVCAGEGADSYPNKPIKVISGFAAGGTDDFMARIVGAKLTERFGQPVVIENRPGATANLAAEIVARAPADGYTLLIGIVTVMSPSRSLYPKLGYDLLKDFSYVSLVGTGANMLLSHPSLPAKSVAEFVALARSKPQAIRYASSGVGSLAHLAMELLQSNTGMELVHVPYKGGVPAVLAIAGGEVPIGFSSVISALPMVSSKRVNALAVSSAKPVGLLPGVPTMVESGFPGFVVTNIVGLLAPAGTPPAVVRRLNAEIRKIVQTDDIRAKFAAQALEAEGSTPEEFRAITETQITLWARIIKEKNITAD